ncbi:chemotaxis protein CheC [Thermonema rossianum]|jgi:chemotaxis protein CheY-P-specific phosphatase CheC|uniref:chemotaxis protein CheC n=1 Tax=Thermonema rossianum TaxID=55505 RepID=UPI000571FE02|nr:hypothetical protein [Thermonema rossianum]
MVQLTPYEFDITRELFSIALANAADAFSKYAGEKVMIKDYSIEIFDKEQQDETIKRLQDEHFYTLTTEIKGALHGKTYLLFQHEEIKKVFQIFAQPPVSIVEKEGEITDIQKDILLELDNIISAAVVTQVANFTDLFIYGDIPRFSYLPAQQLSEQFKADFATFGHVLNIRTQLQSYNTNLNPLFICFMDDDFLNTMKQMIKAKGNNILQKRLKRR